MNKRLKLILLSVTAALAVLFVTMFFLCLPIGEKGGILPISTICVVGGVVGALFLLGAILSFLYRLLRLTPKGEKVYHNKNAVKYTEK